MPDDPDATGAVDHAPRAVIDAGGEPWARVRGVLERRWRELPACSVLELHSSAPEVTAAVPRWCAAAGGQVLAREVAADAVLYRLRTPMSATQPRTRGDEETT